MFGVFVFVMIRRTPKSTQSVSSAAADVFNKQFDAFPDQVITAQIQSLFPASGAQFSLLPPDNATGNFTKVVQRIPVKLVIDSDHPLAGSIRPGMSVHVKVDLRG